jgi:hypothetical protein
MALHASLRQQALAAGAEEEMDSLDFEVYAHGTTATFANQLVSTQGDCLSAMGGKWGGRFFTVPDLAVAEIFAVRTCSHLRAERPGVAAVALARTIVTTLRSHGLLTSPPIQGPPPGVTATTPQFVFERGALDTLKRSGFFFLVK